MRHAVCLLAVLSVIGVHNAKAQTTKSEVKDPVVLRSKTDRMLYLVRYGDAKALAATLSQHYQSEKDLQIVPDANSNALLITGPTSLLTDLVKLVDQLDRRPKRVMIDMLVVEFPIEEETVVDPKDFDKPIDKIMLAIEGLSKKGKVNYLRRYQLAALENQKSSLMIGEDKPIVTGMGGGFGGRGGAPGAQQNQISYQKAGTTLSASPRFSPDGTITVDLNFEESRVVVPENGVQLGGGIIAAEMPRTSLKGSISVASGRTALAQGVKTESKGEKKTQTIVIVGAEVIDK